MRIPTAPISWRRTARACTVASFALASLGACATTPTGDGGGVYSAVDGGLDAAISGGDAPGGDTLAPDAKADGGATDSGGTFKAADHPPAPQVTDSQGAILTSPTVVPVFYPGDPLRSQVEALAAAMSAEPWWLQVVGEYGVGALKVGESQTMSAPAPANVTESAVLGALKANIGAGKAWGPAVADAVYVFVIPEGTSFTDGSGSMCCSDYDGYHDSLTVGGQDLPYAVVCACANEATDGVTIAQAMSVTFAHEVVEAATDPFPNDQPAFSETDGNSTVWSVANGGEIADMCEYEPDVNVQPSGFPLPVVRIWSDAAAAAGADPCVPAPADVAYFNAAPLTQDTVHIVDNYGNAVVTKGIKATNGQTVSVPIGLFSSAPMSMPITVTFNDFNAYMGGTALLTGAFDTSSGGNGDTLNLSIHVKKFDSQLGGAMFILESTDGVHSHQWTGFVGK